MLSLISKFENTSKYSPLKKPIVRETFYVIHNMIIVILDL